MSASVQMLLIASLWAFALATAESVTDGDGLLAALFDADFKPLLQALTKKKMILRIIILYLKMSWFNEIYYEHKNNSTTIKNNAIAYGNSSYILINEDASGLATIISVG